MRTDGASLLDSLLAGNRRVLQGDERVVEPSGGASNDAPYLAALVCCAECGQSPELLFGQAPGRLFVLQGAGTRLDDTTLAGVLFAVGCLRVGLVIVMAHTECALSGPRDGPAIDLDGCAAPRGPQQPAWCARRVARQLETRAEICAAVGDGVLRVVPLLLDIDSGRIDPV